MATRDMSSWETAISEVVSRDGVEDVIVRGEHLGDLVGKVSFAGMMFLILQGRVPTESEARVLDALMVASMEHGIAPPSMVSRCFASYGTSLPAAVGAGVLTFGDRMGGLGEQLAKLMTEHLARLGRPPPELGDDAIAGAADAVVEAALAAGERVPGYGIPLHRRDPRAPQVLAVARAEGTFGPYCRFATAIEAALVRRRGGRAVPMNLDGVGAAVTLDLGFDWPATRLFLITPRTVSMGAHYLEERAQDTTWRHVPAAQIRYGPDG